MVSCLAGVAVFLMALKLFVWLTIARVHTSAFVNGLYCATALLMVWTYTLAVATDAGAASIHAAIDSRVRAAEEGGEYEDDEDAEDEKPVMGYCERCDRPKPARVHHCSTCRTCIYRMDHHCPWTSNCVGWRNKKFFLLFLVYTSLSSLVFCGLVTPLVFSSEPELKWIRHQHKTLLQLGWTLSLAIGFVLAGYFAFHVWLLRRGRTTLEHITGRPGEFEGVSFWNHVRVYFGDTPLLWLVPVAPQLDAKVRGRHRARRETQQLMF